MCMCANRMKLLKPDDFFFYSPQSSWTAVVIVTQGGTMREEDRQRHDRETLRKQKIRGNRTVVLKSLEVRPSEMVAVLEIHINSFQMLAAFV